MKVIHSSIFRAVCAIIVGVLLIQYREQTVTWITIAIGVLFFLSGVISLASYWAAKRNAEKMQGQILSDSNGKPIMGMMPKFPLVSVGSLILGLLLALMPQVFIAWLMFILAFILILGALTQFVNLAWREPRPSQDMDHAGYGIEGGAYFVAHVGQKGTLCHTASFCRLFGNQQIARARNNQLFKLIAVCRKLCLNLFALGYVAHNPNANPFAQGVHG